MESPLPMLPPLLVKSIAGRISEKLSVFLFTLLMAAGFIVFGSMGGVAGILLASGIMGIAEGTALVSQNMIMLDLDVAKKAGTSRMLSIYATIRKIVSDGRTTKFLLHLLLLGHQTGMMVFGGVIAFCSFVYIGSGWIGRGGAK